VKLGLILAYEALKVRSEATLWKPC